MAWHFRLSLSRYRCGAMNKDERGDFRLLEHRLISNCCDMSAQCRRYRYARAHITHFLARGIEDDVYLGTRAARFTLNCVAAQHAGYALTLVAPHNDVPRTLTYRAYRCASICNAYARIFAPYAATQRRAARRYRRHKQARAYADALTYNVLLPRLLRAKHEHQPCSCHFTRKRAPPAYAGTRALTRKHACDNAHARVYTLNAPVRSWHAAGRAFGTAA